MRPRPTTIKRPAADAEMTKHLPPGQIAARRWPVLHQGEVPRFDLATWTFEVTGLVERPLSLDWNAFRRLPMTTAGGDLHCVTRWSKLDNAWTGVPARELLSRAGVLPAARFVVLHGEGGYTANLPLAALTEADVLLAVAHDGVPLAPEHGAPLRAVVPQRYAWKSVKWLRGLELLAEDRPGFWEGYGYSDSADVWREERFAE